MKKKYLIFFIVAIMIISMMVFIFIFLHLKTDVIIEEKEYGKTKYEIKNTKVNDEIEEIIKKNDYTLKIEDKHYSDINKTITYYFFDNYIIIKTEPIGSVLPDGGTNVTIKTIYYFKKQVDISNITKLLSKNNENDSEEAPIITDKNGEQYYINSYSKFKLLEDNINMLIKKANKKRETSTYTRDYYK